jgi:hypothetical protein
MCVIRRELLQTLDTAALDRADLRADPGPARHVPPQLRQHVGRDWYALWRSQPFALGRRLRELGLERPQAEPNEGCLHAVDDPRPLADEVLALAAGAFSVLFLDRRHRDHLAVPRLTAQPAQKHPDQHLGIETVRLGPAMLARDRDARGMDDECLDASCSQPAG